jgi:hypothetical protein
MKLFIQLVNSSFSSALSNLSKFQTQLLDFVGVLLRCRSRRRTIANRCDHRKGQIIHAYCFDSPVVSHASLLQVQVQVAAMLVVTQRLEQSRLLQGQMAEFTVIAAVRSLMPHTDRCA